MLAPPKKVSHETVRTVAAGTALVITGALLALTTSCVRTVQMSDPALKPFASMYAVDRAQYGFSPLPGSGPVSIEGKSSHGGYDAMLHFGGKASRTIAFRWDGKDYQWLGEQESFEGPRMWDTPDGSFHEQVVITYYKQAAPGAFQGLTIQYLGPDEKLAMPKKGPNYSLTLGEVNPMLEKWGYRP
jgi:hypothetical protein